MEQSNLRDSHEDTGTATKSADKIADNGESTDTSTTESGSSWDNTLELTVHALVAVTGHDETLLLELFGDIARARTRDLDPSLGKGGTSKEHVCDEESRVDRVKKSILDVERRRPVCDC